MRSADVKELRRGRFSGSMELCFQRYPQMHNTRTLRGMIRGGSTQVGYSYGVSIRSDTSIVNVRLETSAKTAVAVRRATSAMPFASSFLVQI